ncbi:hypothetical protein JL722_11630 [Aureococcus anophagefferens]|nr:hypothetical protein JL722_11630 [Aureococcus anophagefferens]
MKLAKFVASDAAADDYFGYSVAISGDLVVVGAYRDDDAGSKTGSAYVFRTTNDGGSWTQTAKLVASDAAKDNYLGKSVAISGDLVVVGADGRNEDVGSAYVFRTRNDGASWSQTAKLLASDAAKDDVFGESVAVSGDLVTAKLLASDAAKDDVFGESVAVSGDLVVVGAYGNDDAGSSSGSAYVFRTRNSGASWTQTAKLLASDAAAQDNFGYSVAISGDLVVVGAFEDDDAGSSSGSAYVLPADGSAVTPRPTPRPTRRPTRGLLVGLHDPLVARRATHSSPGAAAYASAYSAA